jgi:hypothetical protein
MKRRIRATTVVMFFAVSLSMALVVRAESGSLSVAPAVLMLRGEVGQTTTQTLSFTNGTARTLSFEMKAQDAIVRDGKRVFVAAGSMPGSIAATAAFSQKQFSVAPRETVHIDVTITIPPHPSVRAIAVMFAGTTKLGTGPLKMTASVGTLLTFALSGDVIAAVASPLAVQVPTSTSNFVAAQDLTNNGTEPVVATGMLAIIDRDGALVGRQSIPGSRLLPGEKIAMRVEYGGDIPSGRYRAQVTYDLTDKTLTSTAEFIVR